MGRDVSNIKLIFDCTQNLILDHQYQRKRNQYPLGSEFIEKVKMINTWLV